MLPYEKRMKERVEIIKHELTETANYGKNPPDRTIAELIEGGIINVNKPKGPTSHQVSEFVKKIFGVKKAGQSGTLDPAVTGVLPVGMNQATRSLQALLLSGKEYVCVMHVHKKVEETKLREVCNKFVGRIKQLPPIKSAVKRQWRYRSVYYLEILEISDDGCEVLFRIGCEAGTYIRKICDDIGKALGCGAHMAQLIRTKVGTFSDDNMCTLQELEDYYSMWKKGNIEVEKKLKQMIFPIEKAVEHIPKIWIFDSVIRYICNGSDLALPGVFKYNSDIVEDELVAIMTLKGELVAIGRSRMDSEEIKNSSKGIVVITDKVLMKYKEIKYD